MTNPSELLDYILEISKMASTELVMMNQRKPHSRFIIPQKRNESYRLSEQEFRVACINAIQRYNTPHLKLFFAVETPTFQTHMISGTTPMSARFDISLYERINDKFDRVVDLEFKSHNAPMENIIKDLHKLVKENNIGAWFHVLQNCDRGTIKSLFNKFSISLESLTKPKPEGYNLTPQKEIFFVFLIVDKKLMITRTLNPDQLVDPQIHLEIDYDSMLTAQNNQIVNGWLITRF